MGEYILEANCISKTYKNKEILQGISLAAQRGEIIALVGANGCGKSTLLRILAGATVPDSGNVHLAADAACAFIPDGYEKINMSIEKFMQCVLEMERRADLQEKLAFYYQMFQMENLIHTPMKYLSKGSLQKVAVLQAFLCEADLLFMDEPLSGQDIMSKRAFMNEVLKRKRDGLSVIMACHERDLIDSLADSIVQIKDGHAYDGSSYIYGLGKKNAVFLVECDNKDNLEELLRANIVEEFSAVGNVYKMTVQQLDAERVFRYCLDGVADIRIIKYEEVDEI